MSKKMVNYQKGFIKQPVIKQSSTFIHLGFLFSHRLPFACFFSFLIKAFLNLNKNILIEPANCKKTTKHHAHLSLCAKSRKINDAKSRKWPKTSICAIF